jgi:hypothetical protein
MNISDINPLGRDIAGSTQQSSGGRKAESAKRIGTPGADTDSAEETRSKGTRDAFLSSEDRARVKELSSLAMEQEEPPREDRVALARERVASGYYNGDEALGRAALQLIRTNSVP